MAKKDTTNTTSLAALFVDLEIDPGMFHTDPQGFVDLLYKTGLELLRELELPNSLTDMQQRFKDKAAKNVEANAAADELMAKIEAMIFNDDVPMEVVACLIPRLKGLQESVENMVDSMSVRAGDNSKRFFTRKTLFEMYKGIRRALEATKDVTDLMMPGKVNVKLLASKSGNYDTTTSGVKTYHFLMRPVGEKEWVKYDNPYGVGKFLGTPIRFYSDLLEIIDSNDGVINGYEIRYQESETK